MGVGVQMWVGVWGLGFGLIVFLSVFVGADLVERWQRRKYRLTREQAFRLHRQMLDYATTDAWQSSISRSRR